MYILGIRNSGFNTSCALMKDGKIVYAICEERLNREKYTKKFPSRALEYCLKCEGITLKDVSHVVIPWNPGINLERLYTQHSERNRFVPEFLYSIPNYLICNSGETPLGIEQNINFENSNINVHYLEHHLCHAAFAYYTSDFDDAIILSMDAWGEKSSTLLARATKKGIEKLWDIDFPHSLGMFYQAMTQYLGFRPNSDEWKVMGASSYGDREKFKDKISQLLYPAKNGKYELNLSFFDFMSFTKKNLFSEKLVELLGPSRIEKEELTQRNFDIAAGVQYIFEEVIYHILNNNCVKGLSNLCLAGGCAMNCLLNGKIVKNTNFEKVNVSFAPDDTGASIGACFLLWNTQFSDRRRYSNVSPYLSKDFSDSDVSATLNSYRLNYEKLDNPAKVAADYIAKGKIIGWFQGKMEFGQRALGNRSILADPRNREVKDLINKTVKFRETFRPFAPAILHEYGNDFFENYELVPYMEKILRFRADKKEMVPAVCHIDGTGRVQSVTKETNYPFWELIEEFRKITRIPMVLNTSFNLNGEPIVHSVKDAIRTFYSCGLDILIIEKYLLRKI